jgi:hypothetical protein
MIPKSCSITVLYDRKALYLRILAEKVEVEVRMSPAKAQEVIDELLKGIEAVK